MVLFPPCKINLGLHILFKRQDGYHELETIFYPVAWTDILEVVPSSSLQFDCTGNAIPGHTEDNLCLKAYHLIKKDFAIGAVHIHLHKLIPTGAGLGGGSSDAAFTLRALNEIFSLQLTATQLKNYASQLGSDCAFFVQDEPMLGTGRGEQLESISLRLSGKYLVIVKPDIHVSTAEAYSGVTPRMPAYKLTEVIQRPVSEWKQMLVNDFENSVFARHPSIMKIKESMYTSGAAYASMSGSGSAVFAIFQTKDIAERFLAEEAAGVLTGCQNKLIEL